MADSEAGWMSPSLILGVIVIAFVIGFFIYFYQAISQQKTVAQIDRDEITKFKEVMVRQQQAYNQELSKLVAEVDQLKKDQAKMIKTYRKRFENYEDRFTDIDELIENYAPGEAGKTKTTVPKKQNITQRAKKFVKPGRQRRTTFSTPSDDEDDMSDSEIALADMKRSKGLDL